MTLRCRSRPSRAVLAGGFPCQDLSVAGARRGMGEGTRSGSIGTRPPPWVSSTAWVVLENVPGLLSSHGGRDRRRRRVAGGPRGMGWSHRVLDAQHFGVPSRRRVVIVGRRGDSGSAPAQALLEPEGSRRDSAPGQSAGRAVPPALHEALSRLTANGVGICGPDDNQALRAACANDLPGGHQVRRPRRRRQPPPEVWAERDIAATLNLNDLGSETRAVELVVTRDTTTLGDRTHALTAEGHDASEDGTGAGRQSSLPLSRPAPHTQASARQGAAKRTTTTSSHSTPKSVATPLECERLQGHPTTGPRSPPARTAPPTSSPTPSARQMGNGVAVPVFEWVARRPSRPMRGHGWGWPRDLRACHIPPQRAGRLRQSPFPPRRSLGLGCAPQSAGTRTLRIGVCVSRTEGHRPALACQHLETGGAPVRSVRAGGFDDRAPPMV